MRPSLFGPILVTLTSFLSISSLMPEDSGVSSSTYVNPDKRPLAYVERAGGVGSTAACECASGTIS